MRERDEARAKRCFEVEVEVRRSKRVAVVDSRIRSVARPKFLIGEERRGE